MDPNSSKPEENIRKFIERFGTEGFLKLFLQNFLFEASMYYLFSERRGEEDSSFLMYFDYKGDPYTVEQVEEFKQHLKEECGKKADLIVSRLKLEEITSRLERPLDDPKIAVQVTRAVESIIKDVAKGR